MSTVVEKELAGYYRQIERQVTAPPKEKRGLLRALQNGIAEYIELHPESTLEDIRFHFGEPEEVAAEYITDITPKDVKRFTRRKKIILGLIVGLALLAGICVAVYFGLEKESPGIVKETGKLENTFSEAISVQQH